ncbi:MAG: adenosylmethionine decarboxylase [Rhodospirillaceae bacterium]|nr:adenosylmethionine decarboxylase [Rhodospirillaceae bacterium]
MADTKAVFQLGIDLDTRVAGKVAHDAPSTAHAEEASPSLTDQTAKDTKAAIEESPKALDHWVVQDGRCYAGRHLIIDLWGGHDLDDIALVDATLREAVDVAGATLLHLHLHHFTPNGGISGVAVLAESHISIHSWPERNYAALDVFMCGDAEPHRVIPVLRRAFRPSRVCVSDLYRGEDERVRLLSEAAA